MLDRTQLNHIDGAAVLLTALAELIEDGKGATAYTKTLREHAEALGQLADADPLPGKPRVKQRVPQAVDKLRDYLTRKP